MVFALSMIAPATAPAACETPPPGQVGLANNPACGPVAPPLVFDPNAPAPPPRLVAWASGFDLNPLNGQNRSGIWIARVDGTQRRRVVAFSNVNKEFSPHGLNLPDDHPSFSWDNRRIVFTSNRADRDNWDIYVMNVNGSNPTRLTTHAGLDTEPVFSPDDSKIAFSSEIFGQLDLVVMNLSTGVISRLTNSPFADIEPAWRPDGQEIAFTRSFGGVPKQKDVFVIKPDGTGERQVTFTNREDHDPSYNPTGDQVVITSERPPTSIPYGNVHLIRLSDGASLGDLTSDVALGAGDPFWSRDGSTIAYFKSAGPLTRSPQNLFVMSAFLGLNKFKIPGEAAANIHPAIGLGIDDDGDGTPNYLESGTVGESRLAPHEIRAERTKIIHFWWKHPRRWRNLDSIWLRISSKRWLIGMVRFEVDNEVFSVFDGVADDYSNARRLGQKDLRTSLLKLDLDRTRVVPEGTRTIRLDLALRFRSKVAGTEFDLLEKKLRLRAQANTRKKGQGKLRNQEDELGRLKILAP